MAGNPEIFISSWILRQKFQLEMNKTNIQQETVRVRVTHCSAGHGLKLEKKIETMIKTMNHLDVVYSASYLSV